MEASDPEIPDGGCIKTGDAAAPVDGVNENEPSQPPAEDPAPDEEIWRELHQIADSVAPVGGMRAPNSADHPDPSSDRPSQETVLKIHEAAAVPAHRTDLRLRAGPEVPSYRRSRRAPRRPPRHRPQGSPSPPRGTDRRPDHVAHHRGIRGRRHRPPRRRRSRPPRGVVAPMGLPAADFHAPEATTDECTGVCEAGR